MESKKELRDRALLLRSAMTKEEKNEASKNIFCVLKSLPEYKNAKNIMVYVSFKSEVSTEDIIDAALSQGKAVAVPLCNREDYSMQAVIIKSREELKKGNYGILEPVKKHGILNPDEIDLCIIPGAVFGKNGHRIGYGKGYYDRFLKKCRCKKIGLCYSRFLIDSVPYNEYDIKLDGVITERGVSFL